jgi:hypothetical protein
VTGFNLRRFGNNELQKLEAKVTESEPMERTIAKEAKVDHGL